MNKMNLACECVTIPNFKDCINIYNLINVQGVQKKEFEHPKSPTRGFSLQDVTDGNYLSYGEPRLRHQNLSNSSSPEWYYVQHIFVYFFGS